MSVADVKSSFLAGSNLPQERNPQFPHFTMTGLLSHPIFPVGIPMGCKQSRRSTPNKAIKSIKRGLYGDLEDVSFCENCHNLGYAPTCRHIYAMWPVRGSDSALVLDGHQWKGGKVIARPKKDWLCSTQKVGRTSGITPSTHQFKHIRDPTSTPNHF